MIDQIPDWHNLEAKPTQRAVVPTAPYFDDAGQSGLSAASTKAVARMILAAVRGGKICASPIDIDSRHEVRKDRCD
jgi:hypothetical protein